MRRKGFRKLEVIACYPTIGTTYGFEHSEAFRVTAIGEDVERCALYKAAYGQVTWVTSMEQIRERRPKCDVFLCQLPKVVLRENKPHLTWRNTWRANQKNFRVIWWPILHLMDTLDPMYWCVEMPSRFVKFLQDEPYARVNYADYGIPQSRNRLLVGNFPIPAPTHTKKDWVIIPELDGPSPEVRINEWRTPVGKRPYRYTKASKAFGRKLTLEDVRKIQGFPEDLKVSHGYNVGTWDQGHFETRVLIDEIALCQPPFFSVLLAEEIKEDWKQWVKESRSGSLEDGQTSGGGKYAGRPTGSRRKRRGPMKQAIKRLVKN